LVESTPRRESMSKHLITSCILLMVIAPAVAGARTLSDSYPAADIERVVVDAGVGEMVVVAGADDAVSVEITLKARRGGLFSSKRRAERQVEEAELRGEVVGRELHLKVLSESEERRFEERWTLEVPARLALELEIGVGDVEVRHLAGGVDLEAGVGDVVIEVSQGDVLIDVGVGNATVTAPAHAYGRVTSSSGVGDGRLSVGGERIQGEGFVGHSASWSGQGSHRLEIEVGVGDARVTLE
jgi:hypothetical protein